MENNLNNLPPFYVGQKVVYITGRNMPKDSIHTVLDVKKDACGCWRIYVGMIGIVYNNSRVKCSVCGIISLTKDSLDANYIASTSFRPLQESVFPSLTMSRVIEKECELVSMN